MDSITQLFSCEPGLPEFSVRGTRRNALFVADELPNILAIFDVVKPNSHVSMPEDVVIERVRHRDYHVDVVVPKRVYRESNLLI